MIDFAIILAVPRVRRRSPLRGMGLPALHLLPFHHLMVHLLAADGREVETSALIEAGLCLRPELLRRGHKLTLHRDGAEAYPRMLQAIRGASRSVLLETYTFADDVTGRAFGDALGGRAREGVDVRVHYDSVGSRETDHAFFGELRALGVKVLQFKPLFRWLAGFTFGRRNHRKLLVVDGRVAFVGGLNISREYASTAKGGLGWRDTLVEIEGPCVIDLQESFLELWTRERKKDPPLPDPAPEFIPRPDEAQMAPPASRDARVLAVSSERLRDRWEIARHYRRAIERARNRIWISSAYFLPTLRFAGRLRAARRRGVDVRLLVPGRAGFSPVLFAMQRLFTAHLLAGIRIFEWNGPMMHAKTMVVDGTWSTVGSYNIDRLSVVHNNELIAVVSDADFAHEVETMFLADCARSREITRESWWRRGLARRLLERLFYLFRNVF